MTRTRRRRRRSVRELLHIIIRLLAEDDPEKRKNIAQEAF